MRVKKYIEYVQENKLKNLIYEGNLINYLS
jgi:hypothetical protein